MIVSIAADRPLTYDSSKGYIGNNTGFTANHVDYTELEDGTYEKSINYATEYIIPANAEIIYSNYDILNCSTGEVFFAKTIFD